MCNALFEPNFRSAQEFGDPLGQVWPQALCLQRPAVILVRYQPTPDDFLGVESLRRFGIKIWYFLNIFCDTGVSPLYIPRCPPGQHLLSAVGCGAGKCKIRPADERLTIISIHNSTKICQIFPDRNIPHSRSMANSHRIRVTFSQRDEDPSYILNLIKS